MVVEVTGDGAVVVVVGGRVVVVVVVVVVGAGVKSCLTIPMG
jgi:hypothetical protein